MPVPPPDSPEPEHVRWTGPVPALRQPVLMVVVLGVVVVGWWPGLAVAEAGAGVGGFGDAGGVHAHGIEYVVRRGIGSGCGDGLFCSGEPISRAEMAAWLYRADALLHDAPTPPPAG